MWQFDSFYSLIALAFGSGRGLISVTNTAYIITNLLLGSPMILVLSVLKGWVTCITRLQYGIIFTHSPMAPIIPPIPCVADEV